MRGGSDESSDEIDDDGLASDTTDIIEKFQQLQSRSRQSDSSRRNSESRESGGRRDSDLGLGLGVGRLVLQKTLHKTMESEGKSYLPRSLERVSNALAEEYSPAASLESLGEERVWRLLTEYGSPDGSIADDEDDEKRLKDVTLDRRNSRLRLAADDDSAVAGAAATTTTTTTTLKDYLEDPLQGETTGEISPSIRPSLQEEPIPDIRLDPVLELKPDFEQQKQQQQPSSSSNSIMPPPATGRCKRKQSDERFDPYIIKRRAVSPTNSQTSSSSANTVGTPLVSTYRERYKDKSGYVNAQSGMQKMSLS